MTSLQLRRWAYTISAALGAGYVVYVLALRFLSRVAGGPLGELGEFLLVLACVCAFAIGLFAYEAHRNAAKVK
jgi:hypothetical protein